jgi:hypothetical protein
MLVVITRLKCSPSESPPSGNIGPIKSINTVLVIDISGVDYLYTASTCDVMYCRHSAAIYIMVVKI